MAMVTTHNASEILEVSPGEVRRLSASGTLQPVKIGGRLLFDTNQIQRIKRMHRTAGRAWSTRTAWAAVELLGGKGTALIDQPRTSRLRSQLRDMDALRFHGLARGRCHTSRYHASPRALDRLTALAHPTGVSVLATDGGARRFGMAAVTTEHRFDGYVLGDKVDMAVNRCRLRLDPAGNVTLRALDAAGLADRVLGSDALVSLDLMDSDDVRERAAGREMLDRLLDAL